MYNISTDITKEFFNVCKLKKRLLLIVGNKSFKILDTSFSLKKILEQGGDYIIVHKKSNLISKKDLDDYSLKLKNFKPEIIIGIGGGSVIDLSKLIIFQNYLKIRNKIKFIVIPTTCGSGSESTKFAVIYDEGIKKSILSESILADKIIHDFKLLKFLPKKALWSSISDSFCQALESIWSLNANKTSKEYAVSAIRLINESLKTSDKLDFHKLLTASFYSGCAINISKTTGPHSFSYFLTSVHSIPHGLAVLFTMKEFLKINLKDKEISSIFFECLEGEFKNSNQISKVLDLIIEKSTFKFDLNKNSFENCQKHINNQRLLNNPVKINQNNFKKIYLNSLKNHV
jgi:alcohol dehydrogenase class IV